MTGRTGERKGDGNRKRYMEGKQKKQGEEEKGRESRGERCIVGAGSR